MTHGGARREPERATTRRLPVILVACLLVVGATIAAVIGDPSLTPSSSKAASPIDVSRREDRGSPGLGIEGRAALPPRTHRRGPVAPLSEQRSPLAEADGAVPDGTRVFDGEVPGVANLEPSLLGALRHAATDAADEGVEFLVNSGWRSKEYQEQLLHEAISTYGSEREAARWVATPLTSPHVSGDAVDLGPFAATAWLSEHGFRYGLCQIYSNEPWHFELRSEAIERGCPTMYADPTHDPRMQR